MPTPLDDFGLEVAMRDANVRAVLQTCLMEINWLITDYAMGDTIFGEKLQKLVNDWWPSDA